MVCPPNKKGSGAIRAPLALPFRLELRVQWDSTNRRLSRQDLAALGTATGKNLAAVGSSHSLAETVDLGTVTAAGLIGTLHGYTSCFSHLCSTGLRPQQHIITDYTIVMLVHYNRKLLLGQPLFLGFVYHFIKEIFVFM